MPFLYSIIFFPSILSTGSRRIHDNARSDKREDESRRVGECLPLPPPPSLLLPWLLQLMSDKRGRGGRVIHALSSLADWSVHSLPDRNKLLSSLVMERERANEKERE